MNRRAFLLLAASSLTGFLVQGYSALAREGGDDGGGGESESGSGHSSGGGSGSGSGSTGSGSTGSGSTGSGSSGSGTSGSGSGNSGSPGDGGKGSHDQQDKKADQDKAMEAAKSGEIMSLKDALKQVSEKYDGKVIDINLQQTPKRDIYQMKLRTPDGSIKSIKMDARTGKFAGLFGF